MEYHDVSDFQFSPEPILENETANNTGQSTEPDAGEQPDWYTFYDASIGNTAFGGIVDYHTPYAKIIGAGDGSPDIYTYQITDEMLNPTASDLKEIDADTANTYYLAADLVLDNAYGVSAGDIWTVTLSGKEYSYSAEAGDGWTEVLEGLAGKINLDATVDHFAAAHSVDYDLSGTAVAGAGETWTLELDGTVCTYTTIDGDTVETVAQAFVDNTDLSEAIPGGFQVSYNANTLTVFQADGTDFAATFTVGGTGAVSVDANSRALHIVNDKGFRIDTVTQEVRSAGTVTRWTKALESDGTTPIDFTEVTVDLAGTPHDGETWTVYLDDGTGEIEKSYVNSGSDRTVIAEELKKAIDGAGSFSATRSGDRILITSSAASFTVRFSIEAASPSGSEAITGRAAISGTPVQSDTDASDGTLTKQVSVDWQSVDLGLTGTVHHNQVWTVTLDDGSGSPRTATYTTGENVGLSDVAQGLVDDEPDDYTFTARRAAR